MCGIVGYIGKRKALPILIDGLKKLEYRGYDSAGVALLQNGKIEIQKCVGKVSELESMVVDKNYTSCIGIGHTRWATHGAPSDINSHPHSDCTKNISIIHNGVIENYSTIKKKLDTLGHTYKSDTDTEALVHLIEEFYKHNKSMECAVRMALNEAKGTYGIIVSNTYEPNKLIVARKGSPLVIGYGDDEIIIASDASALIQHTRKVTYLKDGEMAIITKESVDIKTLDDVMVTKEIENISFDLEQIEKGGFSHFMLKEIYEQPETIKNAMRGRLLEFDGDVKLGGLDNVIDKIINSKRLIFAACGTSWHAALIAEYMIEQYANIPVEVEYASEFRYRNPIINENDVLFVISQSGETADTLAALREAKSKGATALGICNVVGSTIARESDGGVYIHAGPEIGVASTKAFTSQLTVIAMITILLARKKGMSKETGIELVKELISIPEKVKIILNNTKQIEYIAKEFDDSKNFLYLGRGFNFPAALEGALKLKEISYVHAEGYPAAEMKHGPIALIDENMPVVFIAPKDKTYEKIISNIQEVKARQGKIIAIVNEKDDVITKLADYLIVIPHTVDLFVPILSIIPLQLLAYYIATMRGCNVDRPRNLAKSVTVE